MADPNQSYVVNTSPLPVYVLPENYGQQHPQPDSQEQYYQPSQQPPTFEPQEFAYAETPSFFVPLQDGEPRGKKLEESLLARGSLPGISSSITGAFSLFTKHWTFYLGWFFCFWVVIGCMIVFSVVVPHHLNSGTILVLGQLLLNLAVIPLLHGLFYATIQVARHESAEMKLSYFYYTITRPPFFLNLVVMSLLIAIIVSVGLMLLIVPGVYFAVAFMFAQLLYLEYEPHGLSWYQCMTISKTVVSKNWCYWFGFSIVISLFSCLPFCFPIAMIAVVLAFKDSFGLVEDHEISLDITLA